MLRPCALVLLLAACAREPARPNVLLITIDTLRADRLSALGYPRRTTPCLDRLAAEGLVFTRCQSPRAKTTPAVASLMTGLYPHEHGVRDLTTPLDRRFPVIAERFAAAGYATGAIIGNFVLKRELAGLARGFDVWVEDLPDARGVPPDDVPERTARSLTDGALAALGLGPPVSGAGPSRPLVEAGRPWFLWLHYMDPHGLYDPPPEHRIFQRSEPDPIPPDPGPRPGAPSRRYVAEYNVPSAARGPDGVVDAALVRDLYDGEVHYADAEIGRLLDALRAAGLLETTLVVATADHGESLGEHSYWFEHGRDAYEVTCRVPLIVRLPDGDPRRPAPGRRDGDLSLADVGPTLLELAGLAPLPLAEGAARRGVRGAARVALVRADEPAPRAVFCEKVERAEKAQAVQTKAVRLGDWKLLRRYTHVVEPGTQERLLVVLGEELYDLAADPLEQRDLAAEPPERAPLERLKKELLAFSREDVHFADLARQLQARREALERNDRETLRILEALGY